MELAEVAADLWRSKEQVDRFLLDSEDVTALVALAGDVALIGNTLNQFSVSMREKAERLAAEQTGLGDI